MRTPRRLALPLLLPALAAATAGLAGCAHGARDFVWFEELAPEAKAPDPAPRPYVIAAGELLQVRVFNQDGFSGRVRVRPDGKISLPFVNDVQAAGLTPVELAARVGAQLKDYIAAPVVTVSLEEPRPFSVSVVGEVQRPGNYPLEPGAGILAALAAAGGLTEFASEDSIYVVRPPTQPRLRFRYGDLTRAVGSGAGFSLKSGDAVVVE